MRQILSVSEWHEMAVAGKSLPMRIHVHGNSMFPLIRMERDYVTILPICNRPVQGDIILFSDPYEDRYVLHRVIRIDGNRVLTRGDNSTSDDGWISMDRVWGKVYIIERGKKTIYADPRKGMRLSCVWHIMGRGYRLATRIWRTLGIRRIKLGGHKENHGEHQ